MSMLRALLLFLLLAVAGPAAAQDFPALTGRVVDQADLLKPADEAALTGKLAALQQASSRQLVVATVPDLQGYPIEDYGYRLGRHWGIGQKGVSNGVILLVAPKERKVRIEVGYGLEPIVTDALSSSIINERILPAFKARDYPGGIKAGADALIEQLQAPPEAAEQRAVQAAQREQGHGRDRDSGGGAFVPLIFWVVIMVFFIISRIRRGRHGRSFGPGGIFLWGPGLGGGNWGGGSSGGGGGFGGFSGGGGSFGGGGASGGW
jgi:uncharacterized protein